MSELINPQRGRKDFRHQLLAGVSVIALVSLYSASTVAIAAEDAGRPTVWLELGAQSEQMNGLADPLSPPFGATVVSDGFRSPLELQRALSQSFGEQGMISYQPENSSWVFSLSARYGKAQGGATTHDQTPGAPKAVYAGTYHFYRTPFIQRYADTHVRNTEAHVIVDFQVGKDVGLGLLQHGGATLGFGLRFAQFTSKQVLNLNADPDYTMPANLYLSRFHHAYAVTSHNERSFHGLGPAISWKAFAPLIGNFEAGTITLDWDVNAALLFGRQKVIGHHQTVGTYFKTNVVYGFQPHQYINRSGNPNRSHSAIVPNLGGVAGISYRFTNAKLSLGYRADFFFGTIDGGIDTGKKETHGFYGPFATVSVGLGG